MSLPVPLRSVRNVQSEINYCVTAVNYIIDSLKLTGIRPIKSLSDLSVDLFVKIHCELLGMDITKEFIPTGNPEIDAERIITSLKGMYGGEAFKVLNAKQIAAKHPSHLRYLIENYHLIHNYEKDRAHGGQVHKTETGSHLEYSKPGFHKPGEGFNMRGAGSSFYIFPSPPPPDLQQNGGPSQTQGSPRNSKDGNGSRVAGSSQNPTGKNVNKKPETPPQSSKGKTEMVKPWEWEPLKNSPQTATAKTPPQTPESRGTFQSPKPNMKNNTPKKSEGSNPKSPQINVKVKANTASPNNPGIGNKKQEQNHGKGKDVPHQDPRRSTLNKSPHDKNTPKKQEPAKPSQNTNAKPAGNKPDPKRVSQSPNAKTHVKPQANQPPKSPQSSGPSPKARGPPSTPQGPVPKNGKQNQGPSHAPGSSGPKASPISEPRTGSPVTPGKKDTSQSSKAESGSSGGQSSRPKDNVVHVFKYNANTQTPDSTPTTTDGRSTDETTTERSPFTTSATASTPGSNVPGQDKSSGMSSSRVTGSETEGESSDVADSSETVDDIVVFVSPQDLSSFQETGDGEEPANNIRDYLDFPTESSGSESSSGTDNEMVSELAEQLVGPSSGSALVSSGYTESSKSSPGSTPTSSGNTDSKNYTSGSTPATSGNTGSKNYTSGSTPATSGNTGSKNYTSGTTGTSGGGVTGSGSGSDSYNDPETSDTNTSRKPGGSPPKSLESKKGKKHPLEDYFSDISSIEGSPTGKAQRNFPSPIPKSSSKRPAPDRDNPAGGPASKKAFPNGDSSALSKGKGKNGKPIATLAKNYQFGTGPNGQSVMEQNQPRGQDKQRTVNLDDYSSLTDSQLLELSSMEGQAEHDMLIKILGTYEDFKKKIAGSSMSSVDSEPSRQGRRRHPRRDNNNGETTSSSRQVGKPKKEKCPLAPIPELTWLMPVAMRFPYYGKGLIISNCTPGKRIRLLRARKQTKDMAKAKRERGRKKPVTKIYAKSSSSMSSECTDSETSTGGGGSNNNVGDRDITLDQFSIKFPPPPNGFPEDTTPTTPNTSKSQSHPQSTTESGSNSSTLMNLLGESDDIPAELTGNTSNSNTNPDEEDNDTTNDTVNQMSVRVINNQISGSTTETEDTE